MNLSSVTSSNANALYASERANHTYSSGNRLKNSREDTTFQSDTLTISDEARQMALEKEMQEAFSERAYEMLKIRRISEEEMAKFNAILEESETTPDAKAFLKTLSSEERDLVKRANSYGVRIDDRHIDKMTQEGARNLLVKPDPREYVDLNNDGMVDKGVGKSFVFPPPNAPEEVKDAWDKTVEGMDRRDRLLASAVFMGRSLDANRITDSGGRFVDFRSPGTEGYVNIFPNSKESWFSMLDETQAFLNDQKNLTFDPQRIVRVEEYQDLLQVFRKHLGAA